MKKQIVCGAIAIVITGLSTTVFSTAAPRVRDRDNPTVVAPAVNQELIDRGRYVVRTAGCNDCHTPGYAAVGGNVEERRWLIGDSLGYQGAWGTTYPINLRLFLQTITEDQWLIIARAPSRPPMPWFALRDMTDEDLIAVYHYVRSLGGAGELAPEYLPPGKTAATPVVMFPG
jgi:mono/diheme cytochrome c family protein